MPIREQLTFRRIFCALAILMLGGLPVLSCGGGKSELQGRQLIGLTVQPNNASVLQGATFPFSATATFDQAPTSEDDFPAHWASSDSTVATIDANGVATCLALGGPITITGSATGKGGTVKATATLNCESAATDVTFNPDHLFFVCRASIAGCQCIPQRTTTLTNSGAATLNINSITVGGSAYHLIATTCSQKVASGDSCDISVGWSRQQSVGSIQVNDDAAGSPQTVGLSGVLMCKP